MFCCNLQAVHEIAAPQARIDAKTSGIPHLSPNLTNCQNSQIATAGHEPSLWQNAILMKVYDDLWHLSRRRIIQHICQGKIGERSM